MYGFDIGTTQSKAAFVDASGKPIIIPNARGDLTTPSVIHRDLTGHFLIGKDAIEQGVVEPEGFMANFKLQLGSTESLLKRGSPFTPTDATAALLLSLVQAAEKATGQKVEEAVFTCPANFRDDAKESLLKACEMVGVKCLALISEPAAAGIACVNQGTNQQTLAVFDLGGGTFDASVIEADGGQITVRSTAGRAQLGGNDISAVLRDWVLQAAENKCGKRPDAQQDALFYLDLDQRIEIAKASLGSRSQVPIVVSYRGQQIIVTVKQAEYRKAIRPLIDESLKALDEAVAAAGLKYAQIDRLIMVGGPSRDPFIQECLANHTGLVPRTDIDPEKAIAYGAALASVSEMARQGRTASIGGRVIPPPNAFVREVTAHAIGCSVLEKTSNVTKLVNAVVVPRNTPVPCHRIEHFYLEDGSQDRAQIEVLQGEPDANRDDCLLIGELLLDQLPPETTRSQRITLEYAFDRNGMVTVTATDKVSGRQQTVSVDYKQGIKPAAKLTGV